MSEGGLRVRRSSVSGPDPAAVASGRSAGGDPAAAARAVGEAHVRRVERVSDRFFEAHADAVSRACRAMARRFRRGGRLLVFGAEASRSDAYHVSVEFVHPVIVGKRALPALAIEGDPAGRLRLLAQEADIALAIAPGEPDERLGAGLAAARERGMLAVTLAGGSESSPGGATGLPTDHLFRVPDDDPTVVQEVQETLYHVLWELVHVFFEHEGMS